MNNRINRDDFIKYCGRLPKPIITIQVANNNVDVELENHNMIYYRENKLNQIILYFNDTEYIVSSERKLKNLIDKFNEGNYDAVEYYCENNLERL